jgi:hypothetical protein
MRAMKTLLPLLLLVSTLVVAEPKPVPKLCKICPDESTLCCKPESGGPACTVESLAAQVCPAPRPKMVCQVSILYPEDAPSATWMLEMGPWCDRAGAELAIAATLARLLGAPPYP